MSYLKTERNQIQRQQDQYRDARMNKEPNPRVECGTWKVLGNWECEPLRLECLSHQHIFKVSISVYFLFSGT